MSFRHEHTQKQSPRSGGSSFFSQPTRAFSVPEQAEAPQKQNKTGMPDQVLQKMESAFNTDFSTVKIFPNSSKAPQLGALAFTQGHHVHFAPGKFNPTSTDGQKMLAHELTHVMQQRQGIVKPTSQIKGLPLNDDPALEKHADNLGTQAIQ